MITVALAVFNTEYYLSECLESILNQTYTDLDVLCIDDCSTDNSLSILKKYREQDNRIRIIERKANEGLAVVRNHSIKEAKGEYLVLLDSDDVYDVTMLKKAWYIAQRENSDMVMWDYIPFTTEDELAKKKNKLSDLKFLDASNKIALLQRPAFTGVKLIKTSIAKNLNIHFPLGYTRQDIPVHWHLIIAAKKISVLPERLTYYRQQPNAATAQKNEKLLHLAFIMDITKQVLTENNYWEIYMKEYFRQQLNLLFGMLDNIKPDLKDRALELIKERVTPEHHRYINKGLPVRIQAKWFYQGLEGNKTAKLKYTCWIVLRKLYRTIKR